MNAARAFYRGYVDGGKRAGQVRRLHIVRDTGTPSVGPGKLGWCGIGATPVQRSPAIFIEPLPMRPPEGLRWCPKCLGLYAEHIGLLDDIAGEIVSYDPALIDLHLDKWWGYVDAQREVRRKQLLRGQQ